MSRETVTRDEATRTMTGDGTSDPTNKAIEPKCSEQMVRECIESWTALSQKEKPTGRDAHFPYRAFRDVVKSSVVEGFALDVTEVISLVETHLNLLTSGQQSSLKSCIEERCPPDSMWASLLPLLGTANQQVLQECIDAWTTLAQKEPPTGCPNGEQTDCLATGAECSRAFDLLSKTVKYSLLAQGAAGDIKALVDLVASNVHKLRPRQ